MQIIQTNKLFVKYNKKLVGYLVETSDHRIAFQYDNEWLETGFSISPFSLPLTKDVFISENKAKFDGLFGVFWDSLPDGWGELLVRRMLSKNNINFDKLSPLQKLSIISKNGLGALEYEPNSTLKSTIIDFDLDKIAIIVEKILNNDNIDLDSVYNIGGSSGGARPKAHITYNNEEWIVKFPCQIDPKDIGVMEYKANKLAKKCGINVNDFKLFKSKIYNGYFGTKRFDRYKNKKIHMISLSAILETSHRVSNLDYGHLFQVIQNICVSNEDMYEAYRRMCFNVFYLNKDDHGKNFSFLYDENLGGYKLSPAYDTTRTLDKFEHEMTVNGNANPTRQDLLQIAKAFSLSEDRCKKIVDNIQNIVTNDNDNK